MLRYLLLFTFLASGIYWLTATGPDSPLPRQMEATDKVQDVLKMLGAPKRGDISIRPVKGASAELGEKIILEGILPDGKRQSKHFICTSCHNVVREEGNLLNTDPEARLAYAIDNDLPFLPGTTLYGAVDRESYYNGDYDKKYGDLVKGARKDLRGAIQLCATECAQGRELDAVEMESVLAYLNDLGLNIGDLDLSAAEQEKINRALAGQGDEAAARELLKTKYALLSPATFVLPPENRKEGYPAAADAATGKDILQRACLHCHENQRYSFYTISQTTDSYAHLVKHFPRYTRYSTYQVSRYGTSPIPGKKAYMPHYTAERMSNGQIESLRGYLEGQLGR